MQYFYAILLNVAFPFTGYNNVGKKRILSECPILYGGTKFGIIYRYLMK